MHIEQWSEIFKGGDHLGDLQEDNIKTYLREAECEGVDLTNWYWVEFNSVRLRTQ
jgi:hypothetical protein